MKKTSTNLFTISLLTILSILSFTTTTAQEAPAQHYQISLIKTQEQGLKVDNYNIVVSNGEITPNKDPQDFLAKLYSFQGEILTESYFSLEGSEKFDLKIPYYPSGKIIKVFSSNNNTEILEINIQVFAQVCGDSNCQGHESYENCEQDCPSGQKDNFCDKVADNICDPDCQNIKDFDSDCTGENPATIQKELIKKIELEKKATNNNPIEKINKVIKQEDKQANILYIVVGLIVMISIFALVVALRLRRE